MIMLPGKSISTAVKSISELSFDCACKTLIDKMIIQVNAILFIANWIEKIKYYFIIVEHIIFGV